jgi:hypothetical protein
VKRGGGVKVKDGVETRVKEGSVGRIVIVEVIVTSGAQEDKNRIRSKTILVFISLVN